MYFGFGHPFNPLLWYFDGSLLADIERVLKANGSDNLDEMVFKEE